MRKFILALVALIGMGVSFAVATNYQMTQGTGTTFGSLVVGLVNYPQMLFCDPTTPSQCGAVDSFGQQKVDVNTSNNNLYTALTSPPTLGSASGGWTPVAKNAIAGSAVAVLSAGAHQMGFALCDNNNAAWTYLQFLDSASPTVGTNVGFLPIPPNTNTGFALALVGIQFSTQMQVAATTTPNGTTAPGTAINCTFGTH